MSRRTAPPTGWPPPARAVLAGTGVALTPLAEEIADRYFERFPQDLRRYGDDVARAWELHDTRHVLSWAIGAVEGHADLDGQIRWLARLLEARGFPLDHLSANLELAGDVVAERVQGGAPVARRLQAAAEMIRRTPSFL